MFNRVMTKDNIAVVALLEHRLTGARLIVANTHIHWDPEHRDVKLVQVAMLADEIEKIAERFARLPPRLDQASAPTYGKGQNVPTIFCGDLNSIPSSGVYDFLSKGALNHKHDDFGDYIYGAYTTDGLRHNMSLKSAYASIGELPFTNYTPDFKGVLDYIFYNADALTVTGVLGEVDKPYLSKVVGFPNAVSASAGFGLVVELNNFFLSITRPTTCAFYQNSGIGAKRPRTERTRTGFQN